MKNFTLERSIKFILGFVGFALLGWILLKLSNLVLFLILALILSYVLDPIVNWLQRNHIPRTLAITITLSAVILIFVYASTTVVPILTEQMVQLAKQLDIKNIELITTRIESQLRTEFDFIPDGFLQENLSQLLNSLFNFEQFSLVFGNLVGVFTEIFFGVLVVPFATFFFLKDGAKIRRDLLQLIPNKYFETSLTLIDKIENRLGLYFRSVLLQSFLVAGSSWATLSVAGLDNSLSVGIAIGLANTIPYFGPIIGYILSVIISILETGDFSLVLFCLLAILIVQVLDNIVFQPLLFSRSADMHPVAILFIILIGAEIAGILGMLIAIPLATIIRITVLQITWSFKNYQIFNKETEPIKNTS